MRNIFFRFAYLSVIGQRTPDKPFFISNNTNKGQCIKFSYRPIPKKLTNRLT